MNSNDNKFAGARAIAIVAIRSFTETRTVDDAAAAAVENVRLANKPNIVQNNL
jgi:hypothetical protein